MDSILDKCSFAGYNYIVSKDIIISVPLLKDLCVVILI